MVLLVSGGSLVGQSVTQCLVGRRSLVRLLATNSDALEPSLQDMDEVHLVPATASDPDALEHKLRGLMLESSPDLVIPCRDADVLFLAELAEREPDWQPRLLCGSSHAAQMMLDKWLSWQFCRERGLPFARSALAGVGAAVTALAQRAGFPLIVKPRQGYASRMVRLVMNEDQLTCALSECPGEQFLVQEYIGNASSLQAFQTSVLNGGWPLFYSFEADKVSIQSYVGLNGDVVTVYATLHVMRNGVSVQARTLNDPQAIDLGKQCAQAFSQVGWRGPLNVQCARDHAGHLKIYEFNGRFTGASAYRFALGHDEVGHAIRDRCPQANWPMQSLVLADMPSRRPVVRWLPQVHRESLVATGIWRKSDPEEVAK